MLDIVPAVLRVKVIRRPRYGCRACEGAVVQAPAPERPITGGMASEALLAHVLVAKYADFLPLYRQAADLRPARDRARPFHALRLGRAGLLVAGAAVASALPARHELDPDLRRRHALAGARPRPWPDQDRAAVGLCDRRPALERQHATGGVYLYAEDRKGEHPAAHLAEFQGVLQVDGYSGFKSLLENRPAGAIQLAFCWAHCRRRFYEIHQATGSPLAEEALRRIGELYAVEAEIRGRPAEARRAGRQERSKPIVEALHAWLTVQLGRVSARLWPFWAGWRTKG